jgi:hypothetical protein
VDHELAAGFDHRIDVIGAGVAGEWRQLDSIWMMTLAAEA